jgi:hypothetical protein
MTGSLAGERGPLGAGGCYVVGVSASSYILAGIDEAGYGPLLGPLCVGLTVFEAPAASDGAAQLDLWKLLETGVCREAGRGGRHDARGRIAVADSKQLKLSSSVKTTHPLVHLERGVLAMVMAMRAAAEGGESDAAAMTDDWLLEQLGTEWPGANWYQGQAVAMPFANDEGLLRIATAQLRRAMSGAGVALHAMRCRVVGEREFNKLAREQGGKAATTGAALREHLRYVWERWGLVATDGSGRLGIACDRQGGRAMYKEFLESCLPGATVSIVEESETRSRYVVEEETAAGRRRAGVSFLVEGEQGHLPIALASMIAKLVRELAMARFNRAWGEEARKRAGIELKPTAGYATDGGRWLHDAREVLTKAEREALVRVV